MVLEAVNLKKTFLRDLSLCRQLVFPLRKRESVRALDSVSVGIEAGQILGVVGPNGAGKTTLLRILADILAADEGTVRICGQVVGKGGFRIRSKIGYVASDERSFFWRLTGRENLEFFARLYGLSGRQAKSRTNTLMEEFHLTPKADYLFRDYSAGMRKKVAVMRALLHEPPLLLLDEVTNSLDPESANLVKEMVRRYASEHHGCAAAWCTHRLEEISQLCDRVVRIEGGRIVSAGPVADFDRRADYILRIENLDGRMNEFCERIGRRPVLDNTRAGTELVISQATQKQFAEIVAMAVTEFGAGIRYVGCIKTDTHRPIEDLPSL